MLFTNTLRGRELFGGGFYMRLPWIENGPGNAQMTRPDLSSDQSPLAVRGIGATRRLHRQARILIAAHKYC